MVYSMNKNFKNTISHSFLGIAFSIASIQPAIAAPGTLPTAPLFLSTIVEPNIFLTLDDSGSMDWESMSSPNSVSGSGAGIGLTFNASTPEIDGYPRRYVNLVWIGNRNTIPPVTLFPEAWVLKNSIGNSVYYSPDIDYVPWAGSDASGNPLYQEYTDFTNVPYNIRYEWAKTDLTATHIYDDSSDSIHGGHANHTGADHGVYLPTYYEWVDDGDGELEADEDTYNTIEIKPANVPFPSGRSYAEEMQNFVNWFVYYRSRETTMKAAVGRIINNTDATRMGLELFNRGHTVDGKSMSDPANKLALLQNFYGVTSSGGTPARQSLQRVGELFSGNTADPSPLVSAAEGRECQQNFNILMTDGYWNGYSPGVGNADASSDSTGFDGDADESNDGGNYEDAYYNTLADVAMHYYETDLDSDSTNNKVPTQDGVDEADHQHLVTYAISFGLSGSLDPETQDPTDVASGFWTNPYASNVDDRNAAKIDDLWHAAYNSRGKFLFAQNPDELEATLNASISDISERTGTAAAVAVNSAKLNTESVVYLAQFNTNRWQGNLFAFPIEDQTTGELADVAKWDASSVLTNRNIVSNPRQIITYDASSATPDGVAFQWSDISTDMQNDLRTNGSGGLDSNTIGEARLDYIRGDRSNEGNGYSFRDRVSLLGDLVNSGPVFVGKPVLSWPDVAPFPEDGNAYSEFANGDAESRQKMVYVGANDGMLHAFNDDTGEEELAYIPGMVYSEDTNSGLHYLANPNYLHKYYVDLTPTLSDIYYSGDWHTVLVGGMRAGGRGFYALDVTDPDAFTEAKAADVVLWEFTSDDDADLGYSYSRPFIGFTNAGTWVAIFGNGYNDTGSGEAQLFIVEISKGIDGTWSASDYTKITTGVGTPADPNGLTTPALGDLDGNGTVDRVYAGDLEGNMWVFDISDSNSSRWASAYKSGSTPEPMFTTPVNQPLTAKPVLAKHPTQPDSNSNEPNIMVYFGSGQYLVNGDKTSSNTQSFYGVWDQGDSSLSQLDLIEQTFDSSFGASRVLTRNTVDYSIDHGWFFDFPLSAERSVTSPIARADTVFFNTFIPEDDPCSAGGFGFKFAVDMTTGGSPLKPTIDTNDDAIIDDDDFASNGTNTSVVVAVRQEGFLPEPVFIEDLAFTAEVATKIKPLANVPSGRFSWQELIN
ncbi:MAG: type IV pilus assembly protein PilY1 [Gammaproteobacteria bacterium]|jgi:type IV pilus assembly protein PilY1